VFVPATGYGMLYLAFAIAGWLRMFGPRLIGTRDHPLDERERMIKARAGHISGTIITVAVFLGCFYFAMAGPFRLWMPQVNEWVALAFLIETCWFTLPVLVASWLQPRPERD
jgi:O-antigen/teichoic acid export membrane protein